MLSARAVSGRQVDIYKDLFYLCQAFAFGQTPTAPQELFSLSGCSAQGVKKFYGGKFHEKCSEEVG